MKLLMYGVNKETVAHDDIKKYQLDEKTKKRQIKDIQKFNGIEEIIILTNDFRNEYYLYVDEVEFSHGQFLRYIAKETDKKLEEVILETYSKFNEDVLRHLSEISTGYSIKPIGSFAGIETVESTLKFARKLDIDGKILFKIFTEVTQLSYKLKLNDKIQPLNRSEIAEYLFKLKGKMKSFKNKNFIVSGDNLQVYYLVKLLLFAKTETITIAHDNEQVAKAQFNSIKEELTTSEQLKLYCATKKSLYYRLSKSDAIIFDKTKLNILTDEIKEEISILRPTRKLQHLIDISMNSEDYENNGMLDIEVISAKNKKSYTEEQKNKAIIAFDDEVTGFIQNFMTYLKDMNAITTNDKLTNGS